MRRMTGRATHIVAAGMAAAIIILLGCVNIPKTFEAHITIDIRHTIAQEADDLLAYIEEEEGDTQPAPAEEADSGTASNKTSSLRRLREFLAPIRPVHAAELKTTSPLVQQIATQLRKRNPEVQALKKKRCVGENNRGYLDLRDPDKLEPEERNEAQRLIAAENKDRKALCQEVAKINKGENVTVAAVERIYAASRLKRAKADDIVQLPSKGESFDEFKASEAGKALGAECVPEAWVAIK